MPCREPGEQGRISWAIPGPQQEALLLGVVREAGRVAAERAFLQGKLLDEGKAHFESIIHHKGEQQKSVSNIS